MNRSWKALTLAVALAFVALGTMAQPVDSVLKITDIHSSDDMNRLRRAQLDPHALVYEKAVQLGDWVTAIQSIHHLLLQDPENIYLQDSLAAMYLRVGNREACLAWTLEKLQKRPDALFLNRLAGNVQEAQGDLKSALERYERVLALTRAPFYRYKVAVLQYQLGRYGECATHIESMLTDTALAGEELHIDWGNGGGEVPLHSALLNLRGNLEVQLGKEGLARKSFKEALKLAPGFVLARNNLDALQAKYQEGRDHGGGIK
jgi:tetratricopeptide (TPR) repeat protein